MNNKIIKSDQINRESLDLDMVLIDEIKDKPDKNHDVILDETHKIEMLRQSVMTEEETEFKRKKEIQKVKKESCCCRWYNCKCCYNNKQDAIDDELCDDIFWHCYWNWYCNNNESDSNSQNNNGYCCHGNWCSSDSDCKCDLDFDCDD